MTDFMIDANEIFSALISGNSIYKTVSKHLISTRLSVEFQMILLTRDKPLYIGLKKKRYKKIWLFEDLLKN